MSADTVAEFLAALQSHGLRPDGDIVADGKLHRCRWMSDSNGTKNGAYVLHLDGHPAGFFQCFKRDIKETWHANGRSPDPAFMRKLRAKMDAECARRKQEELERHQEAAEQAQAYLLDCRDADPAHGYLKRKKVAPHGLKAGDDGWLAIPLRDTAGAVWSLQVVAPDGTKRFLKGGRKQGLFHLLGEPGNEMVITEGFATAASIREATGLPVVIAFDAGNLLPVARAIRGWQPGARIVIASDDDHAQEGNPGLSKAREAAGVIGASVAVPAFLETEERGSDFNDLAVLRGHEPVAQIIREALGQAEAGADAAWPEPGPLPHGLPSVEQFPLELLPAAFRSWVADVSERMQVPPDYVAVAAMTALGSAIGRQIGICPKRHDDWMVVPNLWGAVIGRPGLFKTPALQEALRPLMAMEREAKAAHDEAMKKWGARAEVEKEAAKLRASKIRDELKAHRNPDNLARALAEEQDDNPAPTRRRFVTNDSTVEKLGETLRDNPNGVLLFRDELIGWLRAMENEGRAADRSFYLEAWNGTGRFTYDRIGRGTVDIEAACVSTLGGIQPGPLLSYLEGRAWDGAGDDGLLQRFQLVVWPDSPKDWSNVDRWPDTAARDRAAAVFGRLANIAPETVGAAGEGIPVLHFDDEAQRAFDAWRGMLEARLRTGDLPPAFEAHLSKYRSLLPSLTLICHLADGGSGPIQQIAFDRAEAWCDYLESHALRLYHALLNPDQSAANALGERVQKGALPSPFKLRDVYRPCWSGLGTRQAAQEAVDILCELGWLREEDADTGGRPSKIYHVNPRVRP